MRLLILGGTGSSGILLIRQALAVAPSPFVVVYARNPSKLPTDLSSSSSVKVIQGQLDDAEKLSQAMEGVDAVLSALGPIQGQPADKPLTHTPVAKAYERIIDLMHFHGVKRLIALGTPSMSDPRDKFSLAWSIMIGGVATLAHTSYRDVVETGKTIRSKGADLDWTIVRVPRMTNKDQKEVVAGYVGDGKTGFSLSRAGFATFIVKELCASRPQWVKAAPLISS
ncbi:NAD-P-binding protein [Desarmillaria tabescens]|uniref:NAD-P-binding protein n=1 Tax=Armillaria tabescens TaxID=1929756 RepID=A0AA39NGJ9_ARMTA|nr:NAD-P-binding protein [Desarmillaria tabescens]KAK0465243.1 NAD-P-binding protein [Desarmillaria tabescens]